MEIDIDTLKMWHDFAEREPFVSAYKKAKKMLEEGHEITITWPCVKQIEVEIKGTKVELKQNEQKYSGKKQYKKRGVNKKK